MSLVTCRAYKWERCASKDRMTTNSVVADRAFLALVAFLRLKAEGGDRAGFEAFDADRLSGLFAIAVFAHLDPAEGCVDLGDQLALAVARAQFERAVGFGGGAVHEVRDRRHVFLHAGDG